MKKVVLIAIEEEAMKKYMTDLREFFGNDLIIEGKSLAGDKFLGIIEADLVVLTSVNITPYVKNNIRNETNIVYLDRTILREDVYKLFEYEKGSKAIFVDYTEHTATQMISLIIEAGIRNIELVPVGKDTTNDKITNYYEQGYRMAITADLKEFVPLEFRNIVDIGWTSVSALTLTEIAIGLNIYTEELEKRLFFYSVQTITSTRNIMFQLRSSIESKNKYLAITEIVDDGMIVYNDGRIISMVNTKFLKMFGLLREEAVGHSIDCIGLPVELINKLKENILFKELLVPDGKNKSYIVSRNQIDLLGEGKDYIVLIKELMGFEKTSANIRKQIKESGHYAKYTFSDIQGVSPLIVQTKEAAKKLSKIDATVLITGESGTGKEMFAQSIHNFSERKNMPFVAINCAALTTNLLESELFGYEAGAFTDAKPGGSIGLFQIANGGTIFLDEIAEMPIEIQTKILRVLEEKEIRKIGGKTVIPIDVRVIAASNQDLYQRCEEKLFREDLYYRLNVLPLQIPPLRDRNEDIFILVDAILKNIKMEDKIVSENVIEYFYEYSWPGNIRELANCVQYMAYLGEGKLEMNLLPPHMKAKVGGYELDDKHKKISENSFVTKDEKRVAEAIFEKLKEHNCSRQELVVLLEEEGIICSEYRLRSILIRLKNLGLISYSKGRKGIVITNEGLKCKIIGV